MPIIKFSNYEPVIESKTYISPSAVIIGDVTIKKDSSIWPGAILRGDMHKIIIGERTSIQDNCVCHVTHDSDYNPGGFSLTVGNDVTVGHNVTLHGCIIEDECLIGIGSILLDGVLVKKNVIIGAGSLVPPNKILESGYLYVGSPVKQIRKLTLKEIEFFKYSALNYVKLKDQYLGNNS